MFFTALVFAAIFTFFPNFIFLTMATVEVPHGLKKKPFYLIPYLIIPINFVGLFLILTNAGLLLIGATLWICGLVITIIQMKLNQYTIRPIGPW